MKVVILAGGFGTRLSEETDIKPKPMIEIGGRPMLWHIMKSYSHYGFNDFIILLGYKGYSIKEYFMNYFLHQNDVTVDLKSNTATFHNNLSESWKITLLDTGLNTMTGGRIKKAKQYLTEPFMLTYGDGLCDVNINHLLDFHTGHGKIVSMTSVQPEGRFGLIKIADENSVSSFNEKVKGDGGWINGGYFICQPEMLDYISDDQTIFERVPLEKLAEEKQLQALKHSGFWKCMDTLRDKRELEEMWNNSNAPWKVWK